MADAKIGAERAGDLLKAWPVVLAGLSAGRLVKDVLADAGISRGEINAFKRQYPERLAEWEDARDGSADAFMDEALEVARKPVDVIPQPNGAAPLIVALDAAHARTRIDTLKWAARIRNPRLYGDKAQLDVNVRTVDLTRIIQDANARLAAAQAPRVIEGEVVRNLIPASFKDLVG